jgi:hypothetical protein
MPPSHRHAITGILACRTPALGGQVWQCDRCGSEVHVHHSCRNRSCPTCHGDQTRAWLEKRQAEMLPIPYFHVTVTLPKELHAVIRRRQRLGYGALMNAAAKAIIDLGRDPRWLGGTVGVLAVLHSWTQRLDYHPHVHCLVTAGGLSTNGDTWHEATPTFLFPKAALAKRAAGLFRKTLIAADPGIRVPDRVWRQRWVVHIQPWGQGEQAVLDYLARYAFRIAITNRRLFVLNDTHVTFRYKDRKADRNKPCTLAGHEFMRRYLQHVLPKGFHKIRYFGLWHPAKRDQRDHLRRVLLLQQRHAPEPDAKAGDDDPGQQQAPSETAPERSRCQHCQKGKLVFIRRLSPIWPGGP